MTSATKPRSVAGAIDEVGRWRTGEEGRFKAEIEEIDREIAGIRAAMANLTQRLAVQEASRGDLETQAKRIGNGATGRTYQSVFAALAEQASALSDRAGVVAAAEYARNTNLENALKATAGNLLEEYRQFKTTVEPTLSALPESYRKVLLSHHEELSTKVRGIVDSAMASVEPLSVDALELDVVWAIDAPEGTPDLLVVVVPADEAVTTAWNDRGDDAELWLAARVVQGITQALLAGGMPGARPALGGHLGLLAIEVDLAGSRPDFAQTLQTHLAKVLGEAPELLDARLTVTPRQVEMDWLLPPESTEGGVA
jgi:hypothetical protein